MRFLLFFLLAAAAVAFSAWTYARRELPVAGRWPLAALRAAALLIVLLLLFDPRISLGRASGPARWVLVDASASMAVGPAGAAPWDSAVARAAALRDQGARVLRFGAEPASPPLDSALGAPPSEPSSLLVPALERAAEAGAREVVVLSDLRITDPVGVRAALERLGLGARFERLGGAPRNAGVSALVLPEGTPSGEPITGTVSLFASGTTAADSVRVEVREEDRLVWSGRVAPPSAGRALAVPVELPPPAAGGEVRYRAAVALDGDRFAADDQVVAYVVVDPRAGALVAVSFAADWELRHLLPLLARATGLPARGYLQAGERFLPLVAGSERGAPATAAEVADRVAEARLVVLHGVGARSPVWARDAATGSARALVFATDPQGAAAAGVRAGAPRSGEWYVDAELPTSPLAGGLSGLPLATLPPLLELMSGTGVDTRVLPLTARFRGTGPAEAPILLVERPGGRAAVVLGSGWWRWALRPGEPAEAYNRLWSSVAGWLLEGADGPGRRLQPTRRVVPAGVPIEWSGSAEGARLLVLHSDSLVTDTVLAAGDGSVRTPALPPGSYRYRVGAGADAPGGRFDVGAPSTELLPAPAALPDSVAPRAGTEERARGLPLRTHPLPYLVLLGLLCAEWVGRRSRGLR